MKVYSDRNNIENVVDPAKQAIKIQIAVGTEGLQRLNASTLTDEDKKYPAKIYKLFDDQLDIKHMKSYCHWTLGEMLPEEEI